MVLKWTIKCFTAMVLKRTHYRQVQWLYCCCCLCQLTAGEAEVGLAAAIVLAAWWWLEERWHVGSC